MYKQTQKQRGFALLLMLTSVMLMGGIVFSGYSQGIVKALEKKKIEKNRVILEEAKQALLLHAYNYPAIALRGPGRLPCPDVTNDGSPSGSLYCSDSGALVGRLPWNATGLNYYQSKDADGEDLWYGVSRDFAFTGPTTVNYDSEGEITIHSQSGSNLFNGATGNGVAAVIIAPGKIISRDENDDGVFDYAQKRVSGTDQLDPKNYLDRFFGFDNSEFNNDGSSGFIIGPARDSTQNIEVTNDQMIFITAQELHEVAAKSVVQSYKLAINEYQSNIWGPTVANYRYPWLDGYADAGATTSYDGNTGISVGRVPSIFANYFDVNIQNSATIISPVHMNVTFDIGSVITETINEPNGTSTIFFSTIGDLIGSSTYSPAPIIKYYWDGHLSTPDINSPADGVWEECTGPLPGEDACNRTSTGVFKTGADAAPNDSDVLLQVKLVTVAFNSIASPIVFPMIERSVKSLSYIAPTGTEHAFVHQDYNNDSNFYTIEYDYDSDFSSSFSVVLDDVAATNINISVGVRYYPDLPLWALDVGNNDWHSSVLMAYSDQLAPGADGICNAGVDCLTVSDYSGNNDKQAIMIVAGEHDDTLATQDLLTGLFEAENTNPGLLYLSKSGNDLLTVLAEQLP